MNSAMTHLSLEANLKVLRLPTFLREYEGVAKESVRKNASYEDFLRDLSEKEVICLASIIISLSATIKSSLLRFENI